MGTFNGERFLVQQIDSILCQTYRHTELVISDDRSTDGTRNILDRYAGNPRIKIFYQDKNLGIAANYSFAASKARGELIAFSDQDDIWMNHKIERLVSAIGEYPLVYSDSVLIDENGNAFDKKLSDLKKMYTGNDSRVYFLYSCVWGHGMMITKDLLQKSLPIPATVHHDIWITYQALQYGGIHFLNEALTWYRQYQVKNLNGDKTLKRYHAYTEKLEWLNLMRVHENSGNEEFYNQLYALYKRKGTNGYVFGLVPFMLKHRKTIFRLSKKKFPSHFVEILKQARAEKLKIKK
jgi:glycosyltransferase involved in cell wall biosynthesis